MLRELRRGNGGAVVSEGVLQSFRVLTVTHNVGTGATCDTSRAAHLCKHCATNKTAGPVGPCACASELRTVRLFARADGNRVQLINLLRAPPRSL